VAVDDGVMSTRSTAVTFLGLGAMGTALATAALGAGHPTTAWNRTPGKSDALRGRGVDVAASVAGAVDAGYGNLGVARIFEELRSVPA
jgi:prephenate dehydrogenase